MLLRKILPLLIVILIPFFGIAQETTSQILGTISDGTHGLEGATIVAIHVPTGTKYSTTSRRDGHYNLPGLRVGGPYTLTVTFAGFVDQKQENITLNLGQDYAGDFTLVAATSDLKDVVVSSTNQNKVFNNSRTGAQEIVTRSQIERLPTISRSIQDFAKLEPSANGLSFGGAYSGFNNITLNGADFNNSFGLSGTLGGQANAQPVSLDAIDQIQVNLSPYDVRQGGFTGAGVNAITRSGTNQFKGTVYTYIKGPGTQGYNVGTTKVLRTPFSFNLAGASVGGAIVKNKLFFFVTGEQSLQNAPATSIIPSSSSNPPVPGSVSQANADTLAKLADFLKTNFNYDPGAFQGYSFKTNSYKVNARIDWNINDKNTFSFMYNYLKSYADQFASTSRPGSTNGQTTGGQPGTYSMPFFGSGYRINNNLNVYMLELNSRFSNSASNKLQLGYTKERDFRSSQASGNFPLTDILNSGNIYTTFGYEPYTYNNQLNMKSYQLTDIFTMYKGGHEITFGTQNSYKKYQNAFAPGYNGGYQFSSLSDFYAAAMDTSKHLAKNYYQSYSTLPGGAFPWAYAGATNLSLFAQDKWRASNKFTLVYGIRFDYTTYQNKFTDNPNFDMLKFKNDVTYNVGKAPKGFLVVSPRIGFNWDIKGDKSWQLRGGAGVFEGAPPFVWIENQAANNGVQFGSFTATNYPFFSDPTQALNYYLATHNLSQTSTPTGYSVNIVDKGFKYPTKLKTNIALDKKFTGDWVVTGEFSYTKDINASYMYNANLNETNGFAITNGGDTRTRYIPASYTANEYSTVGNKYYSTGTDLQHPNIGNVIVLANTHKGWSYTATVRIQKTFRNLNASIAYTYQDTRTAMEGGSTASSLWSARPVANTDPNAPTLARPSWYQPHRVVGFASYHFDYAKHFSSSIGLYYEAAPAYATSYVYNGDLNGDGNTGNDLIYIPKSKTDINLIDVGSFKSGAGTTTGTTTDPRTADQIWTQLNNFINQDPYLSKHRGQYAKANSVVLPWYKLLNVNYTQDIYFFTNGKNDIKNKHTLRLSIDIINFGNLLNKNWGIVKTAASTNFLKLEGIAADGKTPLFSFPYADASNQVPFVNSFNNNTSISSRWQMQFGIRYLFN
ncbi:MAG: carboxypeptidase regulatory-like domain-containing protein [Arachidicoccus sp.]|nr:carboxypeptidase regulatory-like domain-containing protein [Arachidicoccus sp.]